MPHVSRCPSVYGLQWQKYPKAKRRAIQTPTSDEVPHSPSANTDGEDVSCVQMSDFWEKRIWTLEEKVGAFTDIPR